MATLTRSQTTRHGTYVRMVRGRVKGAFERVNLVNGGSPGLPASRKVKVSYIVNNRVHDHTLLSVAGDAVRSE